MILSINIFNLLSVIALILKIIGILLLTVLGVIAVLFILLFLVPIRYRVSAENDKTDMTAVRADVKVTYLWPVISFCLNYVKGTGTSYRFKLFGIGIASSDKAGKTGKEDETGEDGEYYEYPSELSEVEDLKESEKNEQKNPSVNTEGSDVPVVEKDRKTVGDTINSAKEDKRSGEEKEKSKGEKKKAREEKKRAKEEQKRLKKAEKEYNDSVSSNGSKLDGIKQKIEDLKKIIDHPGNRKLFFKAKDQLFYLLKHYLPRKLTGELEFGFDKPDMTGKMLGGMSVFPFLYHDGFTVKPDFETDKTYFCGSINAKGKIRLIHLLKVVVIMLLDKDFRRIVFKKKLY